MYFCFCFYPLTLFVQPKVALQSQFLSHFSFLLFKINFAITKKNDNNKWEN